MKFADELTATKLVELGSKYAPRLGKAYEPTAQIRQMAANQTSFYSR
jgi:hypothetical protein